ncbi:hypothetical protein QQZ08_000009 [Neonectria magnoliae]|uniref:Cytochrome P450 n=1 Tax=Neonectria magnoliae TaxID=2732573 RepID=A0ABR1IHG1_9HYPO
MLLLSPVFLAGAAALVLLVHIVVRLASPLFKIPGPAVTNFTSLILKWHELNANRTMYIHHLHQKYGPVVRVSPNEVSFTSVAALKEIYGSGGSGYDKTEFYNLFQAYGRSNCLEKQEDEDMMHQVAADDSLQNRLVYHYSPVLHRLLSRMLFFFAKPRQTPLADKFVLDAAKEDQAADFTVLNRLKEKNSVLDTVDMAAECLDHMAAGIDTTGDVLCFLMWELSQPRSLQYQRRLQEEAKAKRDLPFDDLPFLDAVLNEGLRCFPAIPMSLPRYVPQGGRVLDGFLLPEKTVVSCQAFSLHRINEDVFPDPDTFHPDRWLQAEGDAERRRLQFAFSSGGRGCVGKHLALAEMKTLLRDIYSQYRTEPDASMQTESMAMSDQLISSRPLGKRCLLKFVPLADDDVVEKV